MTKANPPVTQVYRAHITSKDGKTAFFILWANRKASRGHVDSEK